MDISKKCIYLNSIFIENKEIKESKNNIMSKKVIVLGIFVLAILSLSSCRSKKSSCTKVNSQEQIQPAQQNIEVVCVEID